MKWYHNYSNLFFCFYQIKHLLNVTYIFFNKENYLSINTVWPSNVLCPNKLSSTCNTSAADNFQNIRKNMEIIFQRNINFWIKLKIFMIIIFFCHTVLKSRPLQGRQKAFLCGKGFSQRWQYQIVRETWSSAFLHDSFNVYKTK